MAKIEMDISEYDIMRENKRLLEDSILKQKELQSQIDLLTKEKIKALEDAKMKVIKISKSEVTEHLFRKRPDVEILQRLFHKLGVHISRYTDVEAYMIHADLSSVFYEKTKIISSPIEETTIHGLDEIKVEIREDLKKQIDSGISQKLEEAEKLSIKMKEVLESNKKLNTNNDILEEQIKKLLEKEIETTKEIDIVREENKSLVEKLIEERSIPWIIRIFTKNK